MPRRVYKKPPIVEALCEFRFPPTEDWDLTLPGRLFERVKGTYNGKPKHEQSLAASIRIGPQAAAIHQGGSTIRLPDSTDTKHIAITANAMSIHLLQQPYPGWEAFRPLISEALDAYLETAAPLGIQRVGVRYINMISYSGDPRVAGQLLTALPLTPIHQHQLVKGFFSRVESVYPDKKAHLSYTIATAREAPQHRAPTAFIVDLDVYSEFSAAPMSGRDAMLLVDDLRLREREAFELMVTDAAREMFDA